MRLPNPLRWLRTRNAAIASRRADHAARTKGGLFAKDQTPDPCHWCGGRGYYLADLKRWQPCPDGHPTPDVLTALAAHVDVDPQPTYREQVCCHRWDVDPDVDSGVHTVQHLCVVAIPSHGYHECACGVWRMEIGAGL